jgi:DNA-binding transcriptional LysR family regulator
MDLHQLRSFSAVAELGNLTRAAERLHLSQPAVSAQIKALEDQLEQRLFHRTSAGMELTQAGRRLLELAERVVSAAEDLKLAARALKGEVSGKLRIGTLSDPDFIRLGEFLGRALERYPLLELELQNGITGTALAHVKDGTLDASFYFGALRDGGIESLPLATMTYCFAAPAAWAERIRDADWAAIAQMTWVLPPEASIANGEIRAMFREHGVELSTHVEADNEGVISNLIASGVGVSLMREDLARAAERDGLVCIWERARLDTTLQFIYLRERGIDPAMVALAEVLAETWHLEPPARLQRPASKRRATASA